MSQHLTLPMICREAGISEVTARRYLADFNPFRAPLGNHRFKPDEKAAVLALIESKRQRRRMNANNAVFKDSGDSSLTG